MGGTEDDFFEAWSPEFREASIQSGLDTMLKKIEFACGLAYGTLSDPQSVDKTATEVKTSRQRTYATIAGAQKALEAALKHLVWAMDVWATIGGLAPAGTYEVAFEFDDSVVVDRDMQFKQDLQLVGSGIMSKVEFRMRNFRESEEIARQKIAEVLAEQPQDMFEDANR
jgi:A118 family predicted phage portal protein